MLEITQGATRVDKRWVVTRTMQRRGPPHMLVGDIDQFTQDGNLKLQLDTVQRGLESSLVDIEVHKLNHHQRDIHEDTRNIDSKQLHDSLATDMILIHAQHTIRLP